MEPTPEMRRAVYDADCADLGHVLGFDNVVQTRGTDGAIVVAGPEGRQAFIQCRRCGKVWLVEGDPGYDYEQAADAVNARRLPEHRRSVVRGKVPHPLRR